MSRFPALAGLRIGGVRYLNSKPLLHAFEDPVILEHPAQLARSLAAGELDVGLVPIFEALRQSAYKLVDDVAIGCDGPVHSVFLAHCGALSKVKTITADPASLTSVHLLRVMLAEFHQMRPACVEGICEMAEAQLLIGNQAIAFRAADAGRHSILDLGEEWQRCTGLPFVFAVWMLRAELPNAGQVAAELRALKAEGLKRLPEIVRGEVLRDPVFVARYLTEHIRYDLRAREKQGVTRFRKLLVKHGFLPGEGAELCFV